MAVIPCAVQYILVAAKHTYSLYNPFSPSRNPLRQTRQELSFLVEKKPRPSGCSLACASQLWQVGALF